MGTKSRGPPPDLLLPREREPKLLVPLITPQTATGSSDLTRLIPKAELSVRRDAATAPPLSVRGRMSLFVGGIRAGSRREGFRNHALAGGPLGSAILGLLAVLILPQSPSIGGMDRQRDILRISSRMHWGVAGAFVSVPATQPSASCGP
jgi:hypothetical protein